MYMIRLRCAIVINFSRYNSEEISNKPLTRLKPLTKNNKIGVILSYCSSNRTYPFMLYTWGFVRWGRLAKEIHNYEKEYVET